MIAIKMLSGPEVGKMLFNKENTDPQSFFSDLLEKGIQWEIEYEQTTISERKNWGAWDLASRCARALANGRVVYFSGKLYKKSNKKDSLGKVATKLKQSLYASGKGIEIIRDDECGIEIKTIGDCLEFHEML